MTSQPRDVPVTLGGAALDPQGCWRRLPPRRPDLRQDGYGERFDELTLFYDVYRTDIDVVELIGPPLLNLGEGLRPLDLRGAGRRFARCLRSEEKDRLHRHRIEGVPQEVSRLRMSCPLGSFRLEVGTDLSPHFAGRRVLVTQSRNNPLTWISQWVLHHVRAHGIDAVILYDNSSSAYGIDDIREVLRGCAGLAVFAVVPWPYPFGPTGGPDSVWDSDYGQHGAWEHAYRRLARAASTITFGDIDELIIGPPPGVPQRALASPTGVCSYKRRPVLAVPSSPRSPTGSERRYADYGRFEPEAPLLTPKYTVRPSVLGPAHQLMVHRVDGISYEDEPDVMVRHFDGMRIEWRSGETAPVQEIGADELLHRTTALDAPLRRSLRENGLADDEQQAEESR